MKNKNLFILSTFPLFVSARKRAHARWEETETELKLLKLELSNTTIMILQDTRNKTVKIQQEMV